MRAVLLSPDLGAFQDPKELGAASGSHRRAVKPFDFTAAPHPVDGWPSAAPRCCQWWFDSRNSIHDAGVFITHGVFGMLRQSRRCFPKGSTRANRPASLPRPSLATAAPPPAHPPSAESLACRAATSLVRGSMSQVTASQRVPALAGPRYRTPAATRSFHLNLHEQVAVRTVSICELVNFRLGT